MVCVPPEVRQANFEEMGTTKRLRLLGPKWCAKCPHLVEVYVVHDLKRVVNP